MANAFQWLRRLMSSQPTENSLPPAQQDPPAGVLSKEEFLAWTVSADRVPRSWYGNEYARCEVCDNKLYVSTYRLIEALVGVATTRLQGHVIDGMVIYCESCRRFRRAHPKPGLNKAYPVLDGHTVFRELELPDPLPSIARSEVFPYGCPVCHDQPVTVEGFCSLQVEGHYPLREERFVFARCAKCDDEWRISEWELIENDYEHAGGQLVSRGFTGRRYLWQQPGRRWEVSTCSKCGASKAKYENRSRSQCLNCDDREFFNSD